MVKPVRVVITLNYPWNVLADNYVSCMDDFVNLKIWHLSHLLAFIELGRPLWTYDVFKINEKK